MTTVAASQSRKYIPAKPLKELSYDYLLFLSSLYYIPFEYSYYVCEYIRHERYLDIYNKYRTSHREILNMIDEEIEEIRKVLYEFICKEVSEAELENCKRNSNYLYTNVLMDMQYKSYPEEQESKVMKYLKNNLNGDVKELVEKLEKAI